MYDFVKDAYAKLGKDKYLAALAAAGELMRGMTVIDENDGEILDLPGTYSHEIAKHLPHVIKRVSGSRRKVYAQGSGSALRVALMEALQELQK